MKTFYINMYELSRLFDFLDRGFGYRLDKVNFGEQYQQITNDICEFLRKYNRQVICKHYEDYSVIYL
jgi:hypothetical protein